MIKLNHSNTITDSLTVYTFTNCWKLARY